MKKSPIARRINEYGCEVQLWNEREGDRYVVTGTDHSGRRFKRIYNNWVVADCINIWNGSIWLLRDGKKHLITRKKNY